MRATSLLRELLGLQQTRIMGFQFTTTALVVDVAPATRTPRCGCCGRGCHGRGYDQRERHWRHLDIVGLRVLLRYGIRRVDCARCGVTTELVPWAEPMSPFTRMFEEVAAYFAQRADQTTVSKTMGVAWRTVGNIIQRVVARLGPADALDGLTHIGVDELSVRKQRASDKLPLAECVDACSMLLPVDRYRLVVHGSAGVASGRRTFDLGGSTRMRLTPDAPSQRWGGLTMAVVGTVAAVAGIALSLTYSCSDSNPPQCSTPFEGSQTLGVLLLLGGLGTSIPGWVMFGSSFKPELTVLPY